MSRFIEVTRCEYPSDKKYSILINVDHIFIVEPHDNNQCLIRFNATGDFNNPHQKEYVAESYETIKGWINGN